jgi:hypothetical protein
MSNGKLALNGLLHAVGTTVYIVLVSLLLFNANRVFGGAPSLLVTITMLCLAVLSASIIGTIMLGRPVLWYFNGAKTEAVRLFLWSLTWLLLFTVVFLILMATVLKTSVQVYY